MRIENSQKATEPLENLIRDGITPRLAGVKMKIVCCAAGDVLVIRIPRSWDKPHMVTIGHVDKFYIRTAIGSSPMSIDEIRRAFSEQGELRAAITRWRMERLRMIEYGKGPVALSEGTVMLFHVIPADAFAPRVFTETWRIEEPEKSKIRVPGHNWANGRYNADGFLCHGLAREKQGSSGPPEFDAYTQLFRSGIVEYCFTHSYPSRTTPHPDVPLIRGLAFEQEFVSCYKDAHSRFLRNGWSGSFYIGFSLIGIEGKIMYINQFARNGNEPLIRQNLFSSPEVYVDLSTAKEDPLFERTLLPLVDTLWQLGGLEETPHKIEGKWDPFARYQ